MDVERAYIAHGEAMLRHAQLMLGSSSGAEDAVRRERDRRLLRAVMDLPMKYREPVLLVYYHDLSQQQAAEALGLSDTAFRTRLMRARRALREMLGEEILL